MPNPGALTPRPQPTTPTRTVTTSISYQGQLPPPEMLARFNEIIPNGADRIVGMAERQQQHRHQLESAVVNGNVRAQSRGQWFGFLLGLLAIGGGIGLIAYDKDTAGLTAIIAAFVALAGVFVYGKIEQEKERQRKRDELREAASQPRLPLDE